MTTAKNTSQYTTAMEAAIRAEHVLNAEVAARLAGEFGPKFTARGVIAKISRMPDVTYQRKAKVTKSGGAVEQKEAIVAEIAKIVDANLDGLDKAPKPVLQTLRDFLAA
jgi:hypothetical protein